jgi:site-specific DNA-cytosine methylase
VRVLSLFDGMSCGQVALKQLGITPTAYYASEIDKWAIKVTKENFPDTIHIGDVNDVDFTEYRDIDLLIGGSPCQGFSTSGTKKHWEDPRSKLFFKYMLALQVCRPKAFLLENVRMRDTSMQVITDHIGRAPHIINSSLVSAQQRNRAYWTDIKIDPVADRQVRLSDILERDPSPESVVWLSDSTKKRFEGYGVPFVTYDQMKSRCHGAEEYLKNGKQGNYLLAGDRIRKFTVNEVRKLQTLPDWYKLNVSNSQAYRLLGNGWTIEVIMHLLKGMKK